MAVKLGETTNSVLEGYLALINYKLTFHGKTLEDNSVEFDYKFFDSAILAASNAQIPDFSTALPYFIIDRLVI